MPFSVKIKILVLGIFGLWIFLATLIISPILGFLFLAGILLYIEMRYERWNFFGEVLLDVRTCGPKKVALTFDDGPSVFTAQILDILKAENIQATFFFLGRNLERHPEIAKRAVSEGHAVGVHGYEHRKYHFMGLNEIRRDLDLAVEAFKKAGVAFLPLVRFPHGAKNIFAVKEIERRGWTLCAWGRGVWDSRRPGAHLIAERARALQEGEILLLHDGDGTNPQPDRSQTVEALKWIIQDLKSRDLSFVRLDQAAQSISPEGLQASPPDEARSQPPSAFS